MNNALLKRFLSVVMAVAMVMSMVVIPVAADEADGGTSCTEHNYVDGECQCGATEPKSECDHANKQEDVTPATCTEDGSKTVACGDCEEIISTETIPAGHNWGEEGECECGAEKPAEKTAVDETPKECTCKVRCNEQAAEDCAVCKDNVNDCTGKTAEDIDAEQKAAVEAAAKEASDQKVAAVQALIDALPNEVKRTEMAQYKKQVDAITAILNTMTEEQTTQLTGLDKLYPTNIIENAVAWIGEQGYTSVQAAVDEAIKTAGTYTITLMSGTITEDVTVKQTSGVHLTISGASDGTVLAGVLTIDGGSQAISNQSVTIQGITFEASGITGDRCISIPDGNSRYTCNVTISGCTFKDTGATDYGTVAIKQATGGCHNWTIQNCTVDGTMHSLLQAKNFEDSLIISGCTVNSKNGVSLESSANVTINGNTFNVKGYAIRTGASSGGNEAAEKIVLTNNTIRTSSGEGGDAAIVLRGSADNASITMTGNAVTTNGACHIGGTTATNTVNADANYWGGAEKPAVSGTEVTVTSYYADADRSELKPTSDVVAQVGSTYYTSIEDAITDLEANGGTLTLLADAEFTKTLMIASGKNVVIDLNGHTITGKDSNASGNYELIQNKGTLTITDSTEAKNGKITLSAASNRAWNSYSAVIANMGGTLNVNAGIIEHTGGTDMAYGIDNNSTLGTTTTNISGGTVTSTYRAIRQFANSTTGVNNLNISGGTISGGNKGVWLQSSNQNANKADLTITGGSVNSVYVWAPADTESKTTDASQLNIKIAANTVSGEVKNGLPERYEISSVDGNYVIMSESKNVVQIVETGALYDTVADAVNAAAAGQTIKLLNNIEPAESITIASSKEITIDLNGKTLSMTTSETNTTCLIQNNGTLTVKDSAGNGKMTFTHNAASNSFAANTILNCGTLTVEGGTIENTSGGIAYAIDNNSTVRAVSATITGGNVLSTGNGYPDGIRLFANGNTNTVNISGGTITSVWMQNPSDGSNGRNTNDPTASLTISNGNVGRLELEPSSNFNVAVSGGSISSVKYFDCAENENRKPTGFISGGTFDNQPADDMLKENYTTVQNNNNKYVVAVDESKIVAKIGDTPYFSIEDAIADSANGIIVLAKSVELTAPLAITSVDTVKIDLNGFNITNTSGEAFKVAGPLTLSGKGTVKGSVDTILMQTGGNLTVNDDVVVEAGSDCAILSTNTGNDDGSRPGDFTVTINGGKVTTTSNSYAAIQFNGNATGVTLNVKGGEISANDVGIYFPCQGDLNISGGTVTGATGVYVKGGNLSVTGGTIKGTGTKADYEVNGNGGDATGDALVVAKESAYQLGTVSITGGTFTSTNAAPIASYARDGQTAKSEFVSGGTFSGKTALSDDVVVASKRVPDNTSGTYTLEDAPSSTDANGNTTYYADLDEMLDKNVTSITLNANETLRENHGSVANGTVINANGKTIVGAEGGGKLTAAGQMVIENLGANKASMVLEAGDSVAFGTDGTMTIRGAYDDSVNYASVTVTHLKNNRMVTDTYLLSRDAYLTMNASGIIGEHPGAGGEITTLPYTLVPVGNVNTYVQASTATLKFESNMFYETFKEAYVDGTLMVSGKDYTVAKGSTIITLSNARLRALSVGKHTLTIKGLDSKTAECPFYVSANYYADTTNPKTGDSIFLALSVMLFTGCALAVIPFTLKKKIH